MLIYVVDGADACLDGAGVDENKQHAMKIYAVRHMLTMQANSGKGTITSQHAPEAVPHKVLMHGKALVLMRHHTEIC